MANEPNGRDDFEVDPWHFAGSFLANMLSRSIPDEPSHAAIPWTPFEGSLSGAKVALLSTAGISMKDDTPFDMDYERKHPTRGDSTFRRLRADATADQIEANHLHIDTGYIERDLNVALPLDPGGGGPGRIPGRDALFDHGFSGLRFEPARERVRAGHRRNHEERGGRSGTSRASLTRLLPVRGTGRKEDRGSRYPDGDPQHDLGLPTTRRYAACCRH